MSKIQLKQLTKNYQQNQVIPPLDLTIPSEQITTLIGPSGSGKSTLLNMIAGLQTPSSGQIYFDDQLIFDGATGQNVAPAQRQLAMVFQDFALWPHMTVFQNVAFAIAPKLSATALTEHVHAVLEQVGLTKLADRYPSELSGGQQQRVALARAIAVKPKLILFDEALSALDPQLRANLQLEISDLIHRNHLTAIFVTHDRQEALRISDNVVLIQAGHVVQSGPAADLYQHPVNAFAASFTGPVNVIDSHHAIRPEHVHLATPTTTAPTVEGTVLNSVFIGDRFDTLVTVGDHQWHVYTTDYCATVPVKLALTTDDLLTY